MAGISQVDSVPLMLFYGQSWMGQNSNNGRVLHENPYPEHALMLGGYNALVVRERGAITKPFDDFCPAHDIDEKVQSVVSPFLYRYVAEALQDGRPPTCVGHSSAVSGARLEQLLPEHDPHYEANSAGFNNLMLAIDAHLSAAAKRGMGGHVPYLIFCQGAGNRMMPKDEYVVLLEHLLDTVQAAIVERTGQSDVPHILMIQPPGKGNGGAWPCLQGQVELCARRSDITLTVSGWAVEQHDRTHFSGQGAVAVGELCAIVARGIEQGTPSGFGAPFIKSVRRKDTQELEVEIAASGEIIVDTEQSSPRHQVRGAPVPSYGFEAPDKAPSKVAVEARKIVLKFEKDVPQSLAYAYHAGSDFLISRNDKSNQSANRGNLRMKQGWKSHFLPRNLHHWVASGHMAIGD
ncbi:hypothetical protein [Roseovarius sp. 2305UL8-3]|uniref:hypothetical protein n=1 Tax=Roseovarius conchicola TaxID=3121636 RepID=UPI0035284EC6